MISALTPTTPERLPLLRLLAGFLERQTRVPDEWVVVLSGDGLTMSVRREVAAVLAAFSGRGVVIEQEGWVPIGRLRNLLIDAATGDVLIHFDDDDYYPPTRVADACTLLEQGWSIVGASRALWFDPKLGGFQSGPFGEYHSLANALAYRREYCAGHRFDEAARFGEETAFTRFFSMPMGQLDAGRTVVQGIHALNTYSKRRVLLDRNREEKRVRPLASPPVVPADYRRQLETLSRRTEDRVWSGMPLEQVVFLGNAGFSREWLHDPEFLRLAGLDPDRPLVVFEAVDTVEQGPEYRRHPYWEMPLSLPVGHLVLLGPAAEPLQIVASVIDASKVTSIPWLPDSPQA